MSYQIRSTKTPSATEMELRAAFEKWGIHHQKRIPWAIVSPRSADYATIEFEMPDGAKTVLTHKAQDSYAKNLRVLYLAIEALRMNDLRGISGLVRAAYLALPAPDAARDPFEVLQVRSDASPSIIQAAYTALAKVYAESGSSPDAERMKEINAARDALR